MKERPILFNGAMVRALLAGTKTQTRRICKPAATLSAVVEVPDPFERGQVYNGSHFGDEDGAVQFPSPYGGVGDRLWVREAFARVPTACGSDEIVYAAEYQDGSDRAAGVRYTTSIHMPRAASRITLEITGVRIERLQDISPNDCVAEGAWRIEDKALGRGHEAVAAYRDLWERINGPASWEVNPWVWVVEFRKVVP